MAGLPVPRLEESGLTRNFLPVWSASACTSCALSGPEGRCHFRSCGFVGTLGVFGSPDCQGFPGPVFQSPYGLQLTQELPRLGRVGPRVGEGPFTNSMTPFSSPTPVSSCFGHLCVACVRDLPSPSSCSRGSWRPGTGIQACLSLD